MMKNAILIPVLFALIFSFASANAQKTYEAKLYNSMKYSAASSLQSNGISDKGKTIELLKLMPGFSISKGKSSLEFVVSSFGHRTSYHTHTYPDSLKYLNRNDRFNEAYIGIQIIRYFYLKTSGNNRLNYYIGANFEPMFSRQKSILVNYTFNTTLTNLTLNVYLAPRISYRLSEKLKLELNIPINVSTFAYQFNKVENPLLTHRQQKTASADFNQFPRQFMLNLGLACKL